jgi:hypothetical protein
MPPRVGGFRLRGFPRLRGLPCLALSNSIPSIGIVGEGFPVLSIGLNGVSEREGGNDRQ